MQNNNWEHSRLHLHYSPDYKHSVGIVLENENDTNRYNTNLQFNYLLDRQNTDNSQANAYLKMAAGIAFDGDEKEPNTSIAIAGDWETRRYFISYEAIGDYAGDIDNGSFHQYGRVGVAPYVANYGNIHTWLMLQVEHHPEELNDDDQLIATPLIRLFRGDYLAELGINTNGDAMFNWYVRF